MLGEGNKSWTPSIVNITKVFPSWDRTRMGVLRPACASEALGEHRNSKSDSKEAQGAPGLTNFKGL